MPSSAPLTAEDFDATDRFADTALLPQRLRLADCLQTLTGAKLSMVEAALARPAPWSALLAFLASNNAPWHGHLDPREAHEALAVEGWLEDPRRGFADEEGAPIDTPSSIVDVLSLLSDPQGVATAEALVREAAARMDSESLRRVAFKTDKRGTGPVELRWRVVDVRRWRSAYLSDDGVYARMVQVVAKPSEHADTLRKRAFVRCAHRLGMAAHDVAAIVYNERRMPSPPFAFLRELWALGYGLHGVDDEGVVHLVAPRV